MAKRKTDTVINGDGYPGKRPFSLHNTMLDNNNGDHISKPVNSSPAHTGVIHQLLKDLLQLELDPQSPTLVKDLNDIVKAFEGLLPLLHQPRKNDPEKIKGLIKSSLECLKRDIDTIKNIKIKIVVFGALGLGKSYVLSHLFRYSMPDDFTLLPSDTGGSVTPIPVRIKHGANMKVCLSRTDKDGLNSSSETYFECFSDLNDAHSETAEVISEILKNKNDYQDADSIEVTASLPVFKHLRELIMKKSTYNDVNVELEIVDLPGLGDDNGDSLIGKELDQADIILFFRSSQSGRPMTPDDLANVFRRRKQFDYASRPMFVYLANEDKEEEASAPQLSPSKVQDVREQKMNELSTSWDNLMKCAVHGSTDDSYNVVLERLSQTSSQNLLETFKKESKAVVFRRDDEDFVNNIGDVVSERANNVSIRRNAHPVVRKIFTLTSKFIDLTEHLIKKHQHVTTTVCSQPSQGYVFKPSDKLPFQTSLSLNGNFLSLLPNLEDLVKCSTMEQAHNEVMKSFKEESMVVYLLSVLQDSLAKHWKKTIASSQDKNKLMFSESGQSLVFLAEISCHGMVLEYINNQAKAFVLNNINRLTSKTPKKAVQAEWESLDADERKTTLSDHYLYLVQELSKLFENGTREQSVLNILSRLHKTIENFIMAGVQLSDPDIQAMVLEEIHTKLINIADFTLQRMRDVNPHSEYNHYLTSKMDFPEMKNANATNKSNTNPDKIFKKLVQMLNERKGNPIRELERKLYLPADSLEVPDELDDFQWARILLNVLYDSEFHHDNFGNSTIDSSLKLSLQSISQLHVEVAKRQLFAYQKSTTKCELLRDDTVLENTIQVKFAEARAGVTASMTTKLDHELKEQCSLQDLKKDLAPVFIIPSSDCTFTEDELGNIYLASKAANDYDDAAVGDAAGTNSTAAGLEDLKATIFYVVQPSHLEQARSNVRKNPPNSNISLRFVVLPEDARGLGLTRAVIKILAEAMQLPYYWTIVNDVEEINEFDKNSLKWVRCSFARGILHGQRVLQHCLDKTVIRHDYYNRIQVKDHFANLFPETARNARSKVCRLMLDETTHSKLLENMSILHGEFATDKMDKDCQKEPEKEKEWLKAKDNCIDAIKKYLFGDSYKRIAGVSVGNTGGPGFSLHCTSFFNGVLYHRETNRRLKTYKMVLHNTDALKGLNYLADSALRESTRNDDDDCSVNSMKWEHSFLQALDFYGISNYETLAICLESKS